MTEIISINKHDKFIRPWKKQNFHIHLEETKILLWFDMFTVFLKITFAGISELFVKVEFLHVDKLVMLYTSEAFRVHIFIVLVLDETGYYFSFINLTILNTLYYILWRKYTQSLSSLNVMDQKHKRKTEELNKQWYYRTNSIISDVTQFVFGECFILSKTNINHQHCFHFVVTHNKENINKQPGIPNQKWWKQPYRSDLLWKQR